MKITQCNAGHFYDEEKYRTCPFCNPDVNRQQEKSLQASEETSAYLRWKEADLASDENRTVTDHDSEELMMHSYVTGWLVCVEGPERGRDYRLRYGFNQIGRSHQMDVCIFEDDEISRGIHCSIVYENRKNQFLLVPGKGTLTFKEEKLVEAPMLLTSGDRFRIGQTVLELIAFCRDDVKW